MIKSFIVVNNKLETNVKGIYALGDVKGGPAFTHISYNDYTIVYRNLIEKQDLTIPTTGRALLHVYRPATGPHRH